MGVREIWHDEVQCMLLNRLIAMQSRNEDLVKLSWLYRDMRLNSRDKDKRDVAQQLADEFLAIVLGLHETAAV